MKIDLDTQDLSKLLKYIHKAPEKFAKAQGMWVNAAAFGSRDNILEHIRRTMIVRNDAFLRHRIRVKKAPRGGAEQNREAIVGSVRAPRHTGWAEQERMKPDDRSKTITLEARGGSKSKRVRPLARMKPGRNHPSPKDVKGRTKRLRAIGLLQQIGRTRSKKPFVIFGHPTLPPGLWRFGGGPKGKRKLEPLQLFDQKPGKTAYNPWMTASVKRYFRNLDRKRLWSNIIKRAGAAPKK